MTFIDKITNIVKDAKKSIVIVEIFDERICKSVKYITDNDILDVYIVGNEDKVKTILNDNNIDINKVKIIDPSTYYLTNTFINDLYNLRKDKGMDLESAKDIILNNYLYFGCMLVRHNIVDCMTAGISYKSSDVFKSAFQVVGCKDNLKASSFFIMEFDDKNIGDDGILLYADCGINQNPNSEELADIAILSSLSYKKLFNKEPLTAFLSHSTKNSSNHKDVDKVINALNIAKNKYPEYKFDGEMQFDAAIDKETAIRKGINSEIGGSSNVLIFPDLDSGNIAYKITERLAHAKAYGPLTQGLNKQVNDLSRGSSIEDVIGVMIITAYQSMLND